MRSWCCNLLHCCCHRHDSRCTQGSPRRWALCCCRCQSTHYPAYRRWFPSLDIQWKNPVLGSPIRLLSRVQTRCHQPNLANSRWASAWPTCRHARSSMLSNLCPTCVSRGKAFETQGSDTLRHRNLACPEPKLAAGKTQGVLSPSTSGQAMVANESGGNSMCRG